MMSALILFLCPLLSTGVFGGDVVSVMEGESVTLHADAKIKIEEIEWRFGQRLIASIDIQTSDVLVDPEGAFRGRLQLDNQTGDLKITNIGNSDSGEYKLQINRKVSMTFSVSVVSNDKTPSVLVGETVTLPTGVTDAKEYDVIRWRFGDQKSPIAEVSRMTRNISYDGAGETFRGRLQMDWTGSLTITNTKTTDTGIYEVDLIKSNKYTLHKSFSVTVSGKIQSVSVMEGQSVTLKTDAVIQSYDVVMWMFGDISIGSIPNNAKNHGAAERFRDRLNLDPKTGSLTIMNIRITDTGDYNVKISSNKHIIHNKFSVTVNVPDMSTGPVAGIVVVGFLLAVAVAVAAAGVIYHRRLISKLERQMQRTLGVTEGGSVPLIPNEKRLAVTEGEPVPLIPDDGMLAVTEGRSVILIPYGIEIHKDDNIQWKFEGSLIAERKGVNGEITVHDDVHDGIFKDRLKLDKDSGSLTITDITHTMARHYELWIRRPGHEPFMKTFYVTVNDKK